MSNATRWYCTREAIKAAINDASSSDAQIDAKCEAASEDLERLLGGRRFIPETGTKVYMPKSTGQATRSDWAESENPWKYGGMSRALDIADLVALTSIKIDQDSDGSFADEDAVASTEYELLPRNETPKTRIQLTDYGTLLSFPVNKRVQVVGRWSYGEETKAAGALAEALDNSETEVQVADASKVEVGDTLLIDTEAMFVSQKSIITTGTTLNDTLTDSLNDVTVTLASGAAVKTGEVLLLDSEKMLVLSIAGNDVTVKRAVEGTVLAAHSTGITVYAYRSLTVVRAVNGTTAASHSDATAISKYAPPADIVELCRAMAVAHLKQDESGWTGQISGGEAGVRVRLSDLFYLRERAIQKYGRVAF